MSTFIYNLELIYYIVLQIRLKRRIELLKEFNYYILTSLLKYIYNLISLF